MKLRDVVFADDAEHARHREFGLEKNVNIRRSIREHLMLG